MTTELGETLLEVKNLQVFFPLTAGIWRRTDVH